MMSRLPRKRWVCWIVLALGERCRIDETGVHDVEEFWSPIPNSPIADSKASAEKWAEAHATGYTWKVVDGTVVIP